MATAPHTTSGTSTVPDVVLFTTADGSVRSHELIALATRDGRWRRVEDRAARAAGARAVAGDPPAEAATAAERAFRYARGLVAAEDVDEWLDQFGLTVQQWREHIRREVARDRHPDAEPVPADEETVWVAACCSDQLATLAREQAERMAAAAALGEATDDPGPEVVVRFLEQAVDEADIDRELKDDAVGWLRVRYVVLTAASLDAAAEARLCVVEDGQAPADVAHLLGSELVEREIWLRDAPEGMEDVLLTTPVGGAAPPLTRDVGVDVVVVQARDRLDGSDTQLRAAVRAALADRALRRQVEDRVRWHVRF